MKEWIDPQHDETNYHLAQSLSGQGNFNAYLHKMGNMQSPAGQYGDFPYEDALHTFSKCCRFARKRMLLEMELGELTPESVVALMLRGKAKWDGINAFIQWVLLKKKTGPTCTQRAVEDEEQLEGCLLYTSRCV